VIFGPWQLARKITRERAVARRSRCWGNNILQGIHQQVINHNQSINQSINDSDLNEAVCIATSESVLNKKAELSPGEPRDAAVCKFRYVSNFTISQ